MLSAACKDALRAMVYVAAKQELYDGYIPISQIADDLGLSFSFLSKTMQKLTRAEFLESSRGPSGGIRLAAKPSSISVFDIVKTVDSEQFFERCVLGIDACELENPCALHSVWESRRDDLLAMLKATTLLELSDDFKRKKAVRF